MIKSQVEAKRPVVVVPQTSAVPVLPVQQQTSVPRPSVATVSRVLSPLITAGTTINSNRSANSDASASGSIPTVNQARLAAAAALVSMSVRKSADFNPNAAGSRGSLVDYPGSTTGFSTSTKRSSYAGMPTCKSEFVYNINPSNADGSPTVRFNETASGVGTSHHFHYPVLSDTSTSHGSASSLHQHHYQLRDSSLNSSKGSLYSVPDEQQSPHQAQVMTRIKKSFEQKEEFLKRPALPYWVNVQEAQQSPPVPKEFYAQPQKFARPVWPPVSTSLTNSLDSISETASSTTTASVTTTNPSTAHHKHLMHGVTKTEVISTGITAIEPWSVSFTSQRATPPSSPSQSPGTAVGLGLVPNTVPKPFYGSVAASSTSPSSSSNKQFVTTLTRIQENVAAEPAPIVLPPEATKPNRQLTLMHAPLASPEEFFTPSPTKAGQHPLAAPVVAKRTKPFENGAEKGLLARIAQRGKPQQETAPAERYGNGRHFV